MKAGLSASTISLYSHLGVCAGRYGLIAGVAYIGKALFLGLKFIGLTLYKGFTGFVAGIGSIFAAPSAGSTVGAVSSPFMTFIGQSVVGIATNFIVNAGCEILGIDPSFANMVSSFISGGIIGGMGSASGFFFNFSQAISQAALTGINMMGSQFELPPLINDILSIFTSLPLGDIWSPSSGLNTMVALKLGAELLSTGLDYAVDMFDFDPSIKSFISSGIPNILFSALSSDFNPIALGQTLTSELLRGVTSLGLSYATQELGLNPLLANLGFSIISTAINAGIQAATGQSKDFFGSIFNTYKNNALTLFGYGASNNSWQYTVYISNIINISNTIRENGWDGFLNVLNNYGASFFGSAISSAITETGISIGIYFQDKLDSGEWTIITKNGKQYKEVEVREDDILLGSGLFEDITLPSGATISVLVGKRESSDAGSFFGIGELGVDTYGKLGFRDADIEAIYDGIHQRQIIQDGLQIFAEVSDSTNTALLTITPPEGTYHNAYDSFGDYINATFCRPDADDVSVIDGSLSNYILPDFSDISAEDLILFMQKGISEDDVHGAKYTVEKDISGELKEWLEPSIEIDGEGNYVILGDTISPANLPNYWTSTSFKEKCEIVKNYNKGYGVVTDAELLNKVQAEYRIIIDNAQEGDRIFFSGETIPDLAIKAAESAFGHGNGGVVMNHEGVVTIINNRKYVYEVIPGTSIDDIAKHALKCVPLEEALRRYVKVDSQGNIVQAKGRFEAVRPDNVYEAQRTVQWIKNRYFNDIVTRESMSPGVTFNANENVSVSFKQLVGYYSPNDQDGMICSELFNRAHYAVFRRLPTGVIRYHYKTLEVRISPQDNYEARDKYGKLLLEIAGQ